MAGRKEEIYKPQGRSGQSSTDYPRKRFPVTALSVRNPDRAVRPRSGGLLRRYRRCPPDRAYVRPACTSRRAQRPFSGRSPAVAAAPVCGNGPSEAGSPSAHTEPRSGTWGSAPTGFRHRIPAYILPDPASLPLPVSTPDCQSKVREAKARGFAARPSC